MIETLEGKQCVLPALQARQRRVQLVLIKQGSSLERVSEVVDAAQAQNVPIKYVLADELSAMTKGRSHGGVAALCGEKPPFAAEKLFELCEKLREPALLLLLEGTEDAQNLGYTLRSAEALGAHAVLLKKHVWNFEGAAVSRASSGAFERLPLAQIENVEKELLPLKRLGLKFWGGIAGAKRTMLDAKLATPVLLSIGGERRGLSGAMREICDGFFHIPMKVGTSSLSMSHAACLVLGEAMRQRREASLQRKSERREENSSG
ncbi:MAG: RNA methyltransferase [candidate division KSB1 bacterium]